MDERPVTISVVIGTFGDSYWSRLARKRAIPSVCAQTVQPLELIRRHRASLHEARNDGARDASGDWLCFLDADDELHPGYLAAMHSVITNAPDRGLLLVPAVQYVAPDGTERTPGMLRPSQPMTEVNRAVIGTLIPRRLFDAAGGFQDWTLYEDWDLWLSCLDRGAQLVDVPDAIYRAYENTDSRNRAPRHVQIETWRAIRTAHGIAG